MKAIHSNDYRMYILVNQDIKISKGKLAGQVGHAVMSYLYNRVIQPLQEGKECEDITDYMNNDQKKIILKCPQSKLEELEKETNWIVIRDLGYTQLEPNTLTCINCGILTKDDVPDWMKELKLYN
ncbi:aminoacyl-tRNA hydrolase [Shouchella clausii]|uniref:aminoacyl-tRNA hydrolase n=1 Tax=Shouchella clausii TaxID=79880 RepID=UPI0034634796